MDDSEQLTDLDEPSDGTEIPAESAPETTSEKTPMDSVSTESGQAQEVADGLERSLDPRSVELERLTGWIAAIVVSLILLGGLLIAFFLLPLWFTALLGGVWVLVVSALVWSAHFWPPIEHRHASYRVDRLGIRIRRGVLWRREISVPVSRVQHIDVSQGPLERSYGLGTLVIYTAGAEFARVSLHGLDHSTALRIRDHLLPREIDDAV